MSDKVMAQVWDSDLPREEKAVLLAYADHAAEDGTSIYLSIRHTAWKTGYSKRSVQRIAHKLQNRGILVPDGKPHSSYWHIKIGKLPQRNTYQSQKRTNKKRWQKIRHRIFKRDNGTCHYCGAPAEHIDHILPRCKGGEDSQDNLVAACASCNLSKGGKILSEWEGGSHG